MSVQIIFETHSITEDNELGIATGWFPGRLSENGRFLAKELGQRRCNDGIQAVFASDLQRAMDTAEIAFGKMSIPIFHDWRLRECNYGNQNGILRAELHRSMRQHLNVQYPNGESWMHAITRVGSFLDDLRRNWESSRVLVIGHIATRWAFEHYLNNVPLEQLMESEALFKWRAGWEYLLHS